jgi:hypothetical protein
MSVIPATQEAEIRTTVIQSQPGFMRKKFMRPYPEKKKITGKGLAEWRKVKALSSNPSTIKTTTTTKA